MESLVKLLWGAPVGFVHLVDDPGYVGVVVQDFRGEYEASADRLLQHLLVAFTSLAFDRQSLKQPNC
ncbi:hypothetical protein [Ktedonobacter racemifer]|uniref:hypothetical protein n=1 Tax=Ktedonobacter racemifer TaxID=363277 RepID=UPI00058BFCD1|nr:hypothetical protein [Ktedonobacter racemifer]